MSNRPNTKQHGRVSPRVAAAQEPRRSPLASPILWVGAFVLIAAVIAIAVTSAGDDPSSEFEETAFAEIIGDPLPSLTQPDPSVGAAAPQVITQTLDGERVQISHDDGVARVFLFLAHWCPHCQAELPSVVEWMSANDTPAGVEIVAISTAVDPQADNYPPSAWFEREGFAGTVLVDTEEGALAQGFGLTGFPFGAAVAADGSIITRWSTGIPSEQFGAIVAAAAASVSGTDDADHAALNTVPAADAATLHSDPPADLVVLDVRTPDEFDEGHLDRATLLDFYRDDFADQLAELDRDLPYLLYCRSGNRSGQTLAMMEQLGFTDVTEIDGGINAWLSAGLPVTS